MEQFCMGCGKRIDANAQACPHCGKAVEPLTPRTKASRRKLSLRTLMPLLIFSLGMLFLIAGIIALIATC